MAADTEMVVVGRLGAPFGVKGWVHVSSFTDPPQNLLAYRPWSVRRRGQWQVVRVASVSPHKQGFVARLEDVEDRDAAAVLRGCDIGVSESVLPKPAPDEYYWKDLVGLAVERLDGTPLGTVRGLLDTAANDVLVIEKDGREILVPFIEAVVISVDLVARRLVADWDPDY